MSSTAPSLLASAAMGLLLVSCTAPPSDTPAWRGEVQVHGALRAVMHEGKTGTTVTLDAILPDADLYAVGALSELAGEVTVIGGTVYLSRAHGDTARTEVVERTDAGATLLVNARVPAWRQVTTQRAIHFEQLDEEIAALAVAAGMRLDQRFPFVVSGELEDLQWHVIDGTRLAGGGTSHEDHQKAAAVMKRARTPATLIGFYSQSDQGVFTHMGSTTHVHCVIDTPLSAGHVDHVTIPAGTTIEFPAPGE